MPELLTAIEEGRLHPNAIISHRMGLEQAAEAYKMFDKKEDNCRKVVLTPGMA
jgi:threonine dehydrogenase-like Zn-dependent dehydrogenase